MKIKKIKFHRSFFDLFFLSYLLIVGILLVLAVFLYYKAEQASRINEEKKSSDILSEVEEAFRINYADAEMTLTQISMTNGLKNYMLQETSGNYDEPYELKNLINSLSSFNLLNDFVAGFYIWFWKSDYVVTRDGALPSKTFFDLCYKEPGFDYNTWALRKKGSTPFIQFERVSKLRLSDEGRGGEVFEYSVSIPFGASSDAALGCVSVLIDGRSVQELMMRNNQEGEWFSYIADAQGNIISRYASAEFNSRSHLPVFSIPENERGNFTQGKGREKLFVSYAKSKDGKWQYVSARSKRDMLRLQRSTRNLFLMMLLLSLLVAVMLSFFLSRKQASPLEQIAESLSLAEKKKGDGFQGLKDSVTSLLSEHSKIQQEMEKQSHIMKGVFLSQLLHSNYTNRAEINSNLEQYGIPQNSCLHAVVLANLPQDDSGIKDRIHACKLILTQTVEDMKKKFTVDAVEIDMSTLVFICHYADAGNTGFAMDMSHFFTDVRQKLKLSFHIDALFIIGVVVDEITSLNVSYESGVYALQNHMLRSNDDSPVNAQRCLEVKSTTKPCDYSLAMEMQLIKFAQEKKYNSIHDLIMGFFKDNHDFVQTGNEDLRVLLSSMKNTLMRIDNMCFANNELHNDIEMKVHAVKRLDSSSILSIYQSICVLLQYQEDLQKKDFNQNLVSFIEAHYLDKNFSLTIVAAHFNLSDSYLSVYFKKHFNMNFIAYVMKKRLEQACIYLQNVSVPIEDVANHVGYSSAHSFRRAFKEQFYMTPAEYRESQRKKGIGNKNINNN